MAQILRGRAPSRLWDAAWLLLWAAASSAWCISAAGELGATFDEPNYIARGLERWRTGSYAGLLRLPTMPLAADLQTLPLYAWERWRGTAFDPDADLSSILPGARMATLGFWLVLLFYGMRIGRGLAGTWGGRVAVAALACEPSLLGHAGLATTDVALSACLLACAYHFWRGRERGWMERIVAPTLWFAAAVLAKASALILAPVCMLAIEVDRLRRQAIGRNAQGLVAARIVAFKPFARDLGWIIGTGLLLVFVYCGSDWELEPSFVAWARSLPDGPWRPPLVWVAEHLHIFTNAGDAIARQIRHNIRGHGAYILGHTDPRALWYYFPLLSTIKLSEPLLLAPLLLAVARPRALDNWACKAAALLLVLSVTFRVQIGIRLVFPFVALAVVGLSAAAVEAVRTAGRRVPLITAAIGAAVVWNAASALSAWPHGVAYVNRFWGGTQSGYRYVSDSNYDWGQGLRDLARWQREHGIDNLDVWYFGADPMLGQLSVRPQPLHLLPISRAAEVLPYVRGRHLAASTTLVYGTTQREAHRQAAAFLRAREPTARTTTFLIYDFSEPDYAVVGNAARNYRPGASDSGPNRNAAAPYTSSVVTDGRR